MFTFAFGDGPAPHDFASFQLTGDGLASLGLDETVLAHHGDGAAELEAVSEAASVDGNAGVRALVMAERCGKKVGRGETRMRWGGGGGERKPWTCRLRREMDT